MKHLLFGGAFALSAIAAPATAATFTFIAIGINVTAAGTFTTTDGTTLVDGRPAFTITGISGTFNGQAITTLLPAGSDLGGVPSDNLLFETPRFFTFAGVGFRADGYDADLNFYSFEDEADGEALFVTNINGITEGLPPLNPGATPLRFTLERAPAVPEPASWAMMIGGFALVGGAMRRRTVALAA